MISELLLKVLRENNITIFPRPIWSLYGMFLQKKKIDSMYFILMKEF
jgi:hypothetical protein